MTTAPRRVLMLAAYPETAAATRFRMNALDPYLASLGYQAITRTFLDVLGHSGLYRPGHLLQKVRAIVRGTSLQLGAALDPRTFAAVFVQREAALVGPAVVEWILSSLRGIPLIFDLDDPVWLDASASSRYPTLSRAVRNPGKAWFLMRRARQIVAGAVHLGEVASRVNDSVLVAPSVVSREAWTPLPGRLDGRVAEPPVIGWVGTHSTARQLELATPALRRLRDEGERFEFRIVGAGADLELDGLRAEHRPWTAARDVADFQEIDIGLAPMWDNEWGRGKCAFKQIQYMTVGVPLVSSWVGAVRDFVVHDENGLVATTPDEWYHALKRLLRDRALRARLSRAGRALAAERYCIEVQGPRVAKAIDDAVRSSPIRRSARARAA